MRPLILALVAVSLSAQTVEFSTQEFSRIPGLREVVVRIRNVTPIPITNYSAMEVMLAATHQNYRLYYPTNLTAYVQNYNRRSPWRRVGIGLEIMGWPTVSGMASERIKIKERWVQELLSLVPGAITIVRTIKDQEYKPVEIPPDALPPLIAIPPNGEVVYASFMPE